MIPRYCIIGILLLFAFASLAFADYHYASHSGSNIYPYTSWETATDSVNAAVDAADPGDTVFIAAGDYEGLVVMYPADSLIAIIGAGADSTHLFTHQEHFLIYAGPKIYLRGLSLLTVWPYYAVWGEAAGRDATIENCHFQGLGGGIWTTYSNIIIRNCLFENLGSEGIRELADNLSLEVSNCLFRNCQVEPINVYSRHAVVTNNITVNTDNYSPFFFHYTDSCYLNVTNNIINITRYGGMLIAIGDSTSRVENNSINKAGTYYGIRVYSVVNCQLENNAIINARDGIQLQGNIRLNISYSNLWHNMYGDFFVHPNFHGIIDTTYGILHDDPMFNNPDSGDFRLQAFSPLIDAGDPEILDYDGSRSDIGAFGGPGGHFYEYRDLSPHTPDSLRSFESGDTLTISWTWNTEADFYRYIVWRDTISGFTPWAGNILLEPDTNFIYDLNWDRFHNYYYRVAAYDNQGNLSLPSNELAVINVGIWGEQLILPYSTYIESNYPNPFNNATTLVYYVADVGPQPAEIEITIYDIGGRSVRKLYSGREGVGEHRISWDGRDDSNRELSSGVYFARISQWGIDFINHPRKLVLVK
jgi:hypothetical protein